MKQIGTPTQIYDQPATPFVMSFIGPVNVLHGSSHLFQDKGFDPANLQVFVRPQDVVIETQQIETTAPAKVSYLIHLGQEVQTELIFNDGQVVNHVVQRENFSELDLSRNNKFI